MYTTDRWGALAPYPAAPTLLPLCGFYGVIEELEALIAREAASRRAYRVALDRAFEVGDDALSAMGRDAYYNGCTICLEPVSASDDAEEVVLGAALAVALPLGVTITATAIPAWMAAGCLLVIVGGVLYALHVWGGA